MRGEWEGYWRIPVGEYRVIYGNDAGDLEVAPGIAGAAADSLVEEVQ